MRTLQPGILSVLAVDRSSARPLYRQIYDGYRDAIVARRLRGGERIPSSRSLAAELGISRISVLNAFEQLLAEGYFESRVGSGTFVATSLPGAIAPPPRLAAVTAPADPGGRRAVSRGAAALRQREAGPWLTGLGAFHVGQPPADCFPDKIWSKLVARHTRDPSPRLLHHGSPLGLLVLREAVAEYLRTARAVRCEADQIMIVNGSQQALQVTALALLDRGSPVWIEEPGYFGAQSALSLAGAKLVPVPVDREGLDLAAGIALCPRPRAVFVTPSHQYPLGVAMSAARRLRLLDWARASGAWVIEDDYDCEYRYGDLPIASLQGLDRDNRVLYIGTFTKVLFMGLRLGYIVLPRDLLPVFREVRRAMDFGSPTFYQAVLADFIREGHLGRHFRRLRLICKERREALVAAVRQRLGDALEIRGDRAGMYLTATFTAARRDREVCERAAREGLWVAPLSECYLGPAARQGVLLGYGGTNLEQIDAGVAHLARVIDAVAGGGAGAAGAR